MPEESRCRKSLSFAQSLEAVFVEGKDLGAAIFGHQKDRDKLVITREMLLMRRDVLTGRIAAPITQSGTRRFPYA